MKVLAALALAAGAICAAHAATPFVATGQGHTLAVDAQGRVLAWGSDSLGQLGQRSRLDFETPTPIAGLPAIDSISARFQSVGAVDRAGNVWTWGLYGLGERSQADPAKPARVLGISAVTRVDAGFKGFAAIKTGGQVWGWGRVAGAYNLKPVRFSALDGAVDIAAGYDELLALKPDGSVWQVGGADLGQFVTGTAPTATVAARVAGLPAMTRVHAFNQSSTDSRFAGIDANGEAWVWGCWNHTPCVGAKSGAARKATGLAVKAVSLALDYFALNAGLENGSVATANMQSGLAASFAASAAFPGVRTLVGHDQTLYALRDSGIVDSIGRNAHGQLGIGTVGGFSGTRQSVAGLNGIVSIAASQFAAFAVRSDGVVFGWGDDFNGAISGVARFGEGLPRLVELPGGARATRVAGGARNSFAIAENGQLFAWGENFYRNLGIGSEVNQGRPMLVPGVTQVIDVAAGQSFSVLVRADGFAWFKDHDTGAFGPMAGIANARRVFVAKHAENYVPLQDAAFVLDSAGTIFGFGYDNRGYGIFTQAVSAGIFRGPTALTGLPLPATDFSVFSDHALARLSDGSAWAWGRNQGGQLGDGTTTNRKEPAQVPGLANVTAVAAGSCHSLALRADGTVWSWGCNASGELGDGTRTARGTPAQVAGLDSIVHIAAGYQTSFAVRAGGLVYAWGNSSADVVSGGTLGDGTLVPRTRPVLVSRENGLGNVDRDDWYLDLDPSAPDNRPAAAVRKLAVDVRAAPELQSVNATVLARAQDIGKTVGTYVLGRVSPDFLGYVGATPVPGSAGDRIVKRAKANGDFILAQLTPTGWSVVTGQLTALVNGTLNAFNGANNILNNTPPLVPGSQFCIGYGTDANQMLAGETLAEILTLPGAASDAPGFPCALSGVYVSGPAKSKSGSVVGFKASVVGVAPKGSVQLKDGASNLGPSLTLVEENAAVSSASHIASGLADGPHSIGAHYPGDGTNAAGDVAIPLLHVVEGAPAGTAVSLAANASSTVGDPVKVTATVTGNNPSGTVQLLVGGAALGSPVPLGSQFTAELVAAGLAAGQHSITVAYGGDLGNAASTSSPLIHVVAPAILTSVALSASANPATSGVPLTLTAAVTGSSPAGEVTFRDGDQVLGTAALASGSAGLVVPGFAAGLHSITAEYGGDATNQRVTSPALSLVVELAPPSVASAVTLSSSGPSTLAQAVSLVAQVSGGPAPTGTVRFLDNGATIPGCGAVAVVSGTATCVTNAISEGTHNITATYSGDGTYLGSSALAIQQAVSAGATLLTPSPPTLDFGGQSMQTPAPALTATFHNLTAGTVTVTSVVAPPGFAVTANDCVSIAANAMCSVSVTFTPGVAGAQGGLLAVSYNGGGPTGVLVHGVGEKDLVTHYYRSILRRAPDAGGKAFWQSEAARVAGLGANVNETWFAMAMSFYASGEYAAFARDATGFATDLYNTFFNRVPDGPGLDFWRGQLDAGMPREVALAAFMFSQEFAGFTQGIFGNTAVRAEVDTVVDFYRGLLSRLPDGGGFMHWIQRFRTAQCLGGPAVTAQADAISALFVGSAEYAARNRTNSQYVGDLYNAFLRRGGDLAGVQFWIGQLASGAQTREQLRVQFRSSAEFQSRVNAISAQGCVR